jgi:peptide/nickel transport system permease protein
VVSLILARLKYSLSLSVPALLISFLVSVPLGLWSATFHGSLVEKGVALVVFALYALPSFFVATLCIRFFAEGQPESLGWIPTGGYESDDSWQMSTLGRLGDIMWHIAAPLFCMTYASFAALSRYSKGGTLNVIRSDYIRTARAKGVSEFWVMVKHAARNGVIPIITILGAQLPVLIGGNFVIEFVFQIPGFGLLGVEAVRGNDYTVVVGVTLITAVLTMVGILLSDLLYAVADPRISHA